MREILFKAKRLDNGEWVEGSLSIQNGEMLNDGIQTLEYRIMGMRGELAYVDPETICQYTGVKDDNGKKIWENDIVKITIIHYDTRREKVEFVNGCFSVNWGILNKFSTFDIFYKPLTSIEVIGNVFDEVRENE